MTEEDKGLARRIADHIHENAPAYVVGIFISGFAFAGSATWFAFNIYTDIQLMKCKMGIEEEGNRLCRWTSTIAEDLAKETPETD